MKKKIMAMALCATMILGITAGCANSTPQSTSQTPAGKQTTDSETDFPTKSLNCIVPYSAGGGTDSLIRLVTSAAEKELGESIIVSNVTGGGGQVGITQLFGEKADGYTFGAVTDTDHYITLLTGENVSYNLDSFKYITSVNTSCDVIMASKNSGFETLDDLIAYAKEHPGEITVGVSGQLHTLDAGKLSQAADIKLTTIMHDGASDSFSACLGGQVDALVIDKKFVAQSEGQDIVILASFGAERMDVISEVPTMKELGYDIESSSCRLILIPAEVSDEIVEKIASSIEKTTNTPEFAESMNKMSEVYKFMSTADLKAQVEKDFNSIKELLEANPDILN